MLEALFLTRSMGFALIVCRIAGFVLTSPFPGAHVSMSQRVGLVVVLSWLASGFAPMTAAPTGLGLGLFLHVGIEVVSGPRDRRRLPAALLRGRGAGTGGLLGHRTLIGVRLRNPTIESEDGIMARLLTLVSMLLVLSVGTHRVALAYMLESVRALPVGSDIVPGGVALRLVDLAVES